MNQASLAFLDELRSTSNCSTQRIDAGTQTELILVEPPRELQETIARQRSLIDALTAEAQTSNQRRFIAEEMLHRNNYPKVDAVLKSLGR
jgi:hypothetical protein